MPRIVFVLFSHEGGALTSTVELAGRLADRGWGVEVLHADPAASFTRAVYRRCTNAEFKLGRPSWARRANARVGRRRRPGPAGAPVPIQQAAVVENALRAALRADPPDLVVASAVDRVAWRRIRETTAELGVPLAFYLRGQTMVDHLEVAAPPDLTLVNSDALVEEVRRKGVEPTVVYSVIDLSVYEVDTDRSAVLVVNPAETYGRDLALRIADAVPEIPFVFRESHTHSPAEQAELEAAFASRSNARLLPHTADPAELYGQARVLLLPYDHPDVRSVRPRVVLEAQRNGIPVVGTAVPGLTAACGEGAVLLPPEPIAAWADTLRSLWADQSRYDRLAEDAKANATRPDLDPDAITDRFEAAVAPLVGGPAQRTSRWS